MRSPRAAVVTVTHNSSIVMKQWIGALESLRVQDDLELCVVDSGSRDDEREATRKLLWDRVDVFIPVPNLGRGRAMNLGVARTRAPVLIFLSPNAALAELPPDLLDVQAVADAIIAPTVQLGIGSGLPMVVPRRPSARLEAKSLAQGRCTVTYDPGNADPEDVVGDTLLLTRRRFEGLGGFSSQFFEYFEDADLCLRHRRQGGTFRVDPRWLLRYQPGQSDDALRHAATLDGLARLSGRRLALRHFGRPHAALLFALLVLVYLPRRLVKDTGRGRQREVAVVLDLLCPGRILRRLGAIPPDGVTPVGSERFFFEGGADADEAEAVANF